MYARRQDFCRWGQRGGKADGLGQKKSILLNVQSEETKIAMMKESSSPLQHSIHSIGLTVVCR